MMRKDATISTMKQQAAHCAYQMRMAMVSARNAISASGLTQWTTSVVSFYHFAPICLHPSIVLAQGLPAHISPAHQCAVRDESFCLHMLSGEGPDEAPIEAPGEAPSPDGDIWLPEAPGMPCTSSNGRLSKVAVRACQTAFNCQSKH